MIPLSGNLLALFIDPRSLLPGVMGFVAGEVGDLSPAPMSPPAPLASEKFK